MRCAVAAAPQQPPAVSVTCVQQHTQTLPSGFVTPGRYSTLYVHEGAHSPCCLKASIPWRDYIALVSLHPRRNWPCSVSAGRGALRKAGATRLRLLLPTHRRPSGKAVPSSPPSGRRTPNSQASCEDREGGAATPRQRCCDVETAAAKLSTVLSEGAPCTRMPWRIPCRVARCSVNLYALTAPRGQHFAAVGYAACNSASKVCPASANSLAGFPARFACHCFKHTIRVLLLQT